MLPSSALRQQRANDVSQSSSFPDLVDDLPDNAAGSVQNERAPQRTAQLLVEHLIHPGDRTVRPMITQQIEGQPLVLCEGPECEHGVAGDVYYPGPDRRELRGLITDLRQLAPA